MEQPFIDQNNEGTNSGIQNFFSPVEGPSQNQQNGLYMMPPPIMNSLPQEQGNQGYNQQPQYQIPPPQINNQTPYINPSQEQPYINSSQPQTYINPSQQQPYMNPSQNIKQDFNIPFSIPIKDKDIFEQQQQNQYQYASQQVNLISFSEIPHIGIKETDKNNFYIDLGNNYYCLSFIFLIAGFFIIITPFVSENRREIYYSNGFLFCFILGGIFILLGIIFCSISIHKVYIIIRENTLTIQIKKGILCGKSLNYFPGELQSVQFTDFNDSVFHNYQFIVVPKIRRQEKVFEIKTTQEKFTKEEIFYLERKINNHIQTRMMVNN